MGKHAATIHAIARFGADSTQPATPEQLAQRRRASDLRFEAAQIGQVLHSAAKIADRERAELEARRQQLLDEARGILAELPKIDPWGNVRSASDSTQPTTEDQPAQPATPDRCDWCGFKTPHLAHKPTIDGSAGAGRGYHVLCRRCVARYNQEAKEYKATHK